MDEITFTGYYKHTEWDFPITNILSVENPDSYSCAVTRYRKTHALLTVHCESSDPVNTIIGFRLSFEILGYAEFFTEWNGINLSVAPPDECAELLSQHKYGNVPVDQGVLEQNMLFIVNTPKRAFRIMSTHLMARPFYSPEEYLRSFTA